MSKRAMSLLAMITILIMATGCVIGRVRVGPTEVETQTVERGDAESVRVDIDMGIGDLEVQGGTDELLDAEFTYNIADWKPEVDYRANGAQGRLTISQPGGNFEGVPDDNIRYEWDLLLNEDVPMDMEVSLGVGGGYLDLSGLNLTDLDVETGVGETTVDLTGNWEESFNVRIRGGIGRVAVRLPDGVGVRVEPETGLGSIDVRGLIRDGDTYTNAAYGESEVSLDISVEGGIGEIVLTLAE